MSTTSETRALSLQTPLGEGELVLTGFSGLEQASRLFHFQLDLFSENGSIDPRDIVGQPVSFSVELGEDHQRHFHGMVSRLVAGKGDERNRRRYRADVVPQLWLLTCTESCRIFQNLSVPEIIQKVLEDHNITDFEKSFIGEDHPTREYCVQYRETDFNFLMRLMEEEGIFFTFRHESDKHVLVLGDRSTVYEDCAENDVEYNEGTLHASHITSWERRYTFIPGRWAQSDYSFKRPVDGEATPSDILLTEESTLVDLPNITDYEIYDFPGLYSENEDGRHKTRIRMQEEEVAYDTAKGTSTCASFRPLRKFTLRDHDSDSENGSYVITRIEHMASEPLRSGRSGTASDAYINSFVCIPDSVTFRPSRVTPKPLIQGSQTAVVTGAADEEIWTDEYGRVKVQFFWDREGRRDENTSCWIRCSQTSAGKHWGSMFMPRIGQEVIVTFLEGDPDRPLITGVVYNVEQLPAYGLPDEKTKSYIKTNSSHGGEGYNEIRFEDKADEEQIFVHAEKNMDIRVKADCKERIGGSRHMIVGSNESGDQLEMVKGDKHLQVDGTQVERISGDYTLTVGGGQGGGELDMVTKSDKREKIEGNSECLIYGTRNEIVKQEAFSQIDGDYRLECMTGWFKAMHGFYFDTGGDTNVCINPMEITLFVNSNNFIRISPSGIVIQGSIVQINPGMTLKTENYPPDPPNTKMANEASPKTPAEADNSVTGHKSAPESLN